MRVMQMLSGFNQQECYLLRSCKTSYNKASKEVTDAYTEF